MLNAPAQISPSINHACCLFRGSIFFVQIVLQAQVWLMKVFTHECVHVNLHPSHLCLVRGAFGSNCCLESVFMQQLSVSFKMHEHFSWLLAVPHAPQCTVSSPFFLTRYSGREQTFYFHPQTLCWTEVCTLVGLLHLALVPRLALLRNLMELDSSSVFTI